VYERASSSRSVGEFVVATDDSRIADEAGGFGARVVVTSPKHKCGTERVAEAASGLEADIIVNVQGDEIVSDGRMIDECVEPLLGADPAEVSTLASAISDEADAADPNVVKVVTDLRGDALFFSRSQIPNVSCASPNWAAGAPRRPAFGHLRHVGIYAYRREFLLEFVRLPQTPLELAESLEQLRVLEHGRRMSVVVTRHKSVGVDAPSDVEKAERFLASLDGPAAGGSAGAMTEG
jgi:3-deoxy-manno-octulosonate cytidylyltransferase (CMP-KDO synthetase)